MQQWADGAYVSGSVRLNKLRGHRVPACLAAAETAEALEAVEATEAVEAPEVEATEAAETRENGEATKAESRRLHSSFQTGWVLRQYSV